MVVNGAIATVLAALLVVDGKERSAYSGHSGYSSRF